MQEISPDAYQTYHLRVHKQKPGIHLRIRLRGMIPLSVDHLFLA